MKHTKRRVGELTMEQLRRMADKASVADKTMAFVLSGIQLRSLSGKRAQAVAVKEGMLEPVQE